MRDFEKAEDSNYGHYMYRHTSPTKKTPRRQRSEKGNARTFVQNSGSVVLKRLEDFIQKTTDPGLTESTFSTTDTSLSSSERRNKTVVSAPSRTFTTAHRDYLELSRQDRGDVESKRNRHNRRDDFFNPTFAMTNSMINSVGRTAAQESKAPHVGNHNHTSPMRY
mmetsp:Transcript_4179/g.5374  ORF Transcript_4179/g.5374 Transcript_4179/m.5374 type:complete len:165 (-) Transcript_4179:217-711(-)